MLQLVFPSALFPVKECSLLHTDVQPSQLSFSDIISLLVYSTSAWRIRLVIGFVKIFVMGTAIWSLDVFSCFPTAWCWSHQLLAPTVYPILCYEDIKKTFEFALLQTINPFVLCVIKVHSSDLKSCLQSHCVMEVVDIRHWHQKQQLL